VDCPFYDAHLPATDPRTGITDGPKRKAEAAPVIDKRYAWIATERPTVDDEAPIAATIPQCPDRRHRRSLRDEGWQGVRRLCGAPAPSGWLGRMRST
jgi:hypothetical protein